MVAFTLLSVAFMGISYQYIIQEKKDNMTRNAQYIAQFTGIYLRQGSDIQDEYFQLYVASLAQISGAHVLLCEKSGQIVYATDGTRFYSYDQPLPEFIINETIQKGGYIGMKKLDGLYQKRRFLTAVPIYTNIDSTQAVRGIVLVTTSTSVISGLWRSMLGVCAMAAVIVFIIAAIISGFTSARLVRPLNEMAEAARKFGHGDFSVRIQSDEKEKDEMSALAEAFNNMANSLEQSENRRNEFVANVSHELKTPMTTIAGFAEGILDGTIPPEREREFLQVISTETRRLSRLVRRMLDMSRLHAQQGDGVSQEHFDVSEVMLRVLVSLESKITGHGLDVHTDLPEGKLMVRGDPDGVTQVCYNLLDNAAKFATPGSAISVGITTKDGKAYVSVANEGATVPPEELPLLFERFHKADYSRSKDREGTGLGLYIVKTILGNMKEDITVTSRDGVTEFIFTLTLA